MLPTGTPGAVVAALEERLAMLGVDEPRVISEAEVALKAGGVSLAPGEQAMVLAIGLLETRVALVEADSPPHHVLASLTAGLWQADKLVAERAAVSFLREHEIDVEDDPSLREGLADQVTHSRREADATLTIAGAQVFLDAATLARFVAPINERLVLLVDALLERAGLLPSQLQAVVVISEEPPWLGLPEAIAAELGVAVAPPLPAAAARAQGVWRPNPRRSTALLPGQLSVRLRRRGAMTSETRIRSHRRQGTNLL